ncbi:MAG TPA: aminoacetone oxidase family FAD-binding enzyme [Candidatus Paceibacterota bacterium]
MSEAYDVIAIGGGAAGMMAAGRAAERGRRVLLLERNARLGEKLRISGGGRCNITNAQQDTKRLLAQYGEAEQFLYSAFSQFGMANTFSFFESRGLPLMVETGERAFPQSEKASDVVSVLETYIKDRRVTVATRSAVDEVMIDGARISGIRSGHQVYTASSYIFATGGLSHPETGSTGDGFRWLRELGHAVEKPTPTIVPLRVSETWVRELSGTSVPDVRISFYVNGTKRISSTGVLLFTHFGISGPTVLNLAGRIADLLHEGTVDARVDLFPGTDVGILDRLITEVFDKNKNRTLRNTFKNVAPKGTADVLLSLLPTIDTEKKVHSVLREERRALVDLLKSLRLSVTGLMGFDRAVVADGGLVLDEVDMRTMRSKKIENLFVTGDLLHIRRPSGGYSLQLCWTTGFVAGNSA